MNRQAKEKDFKLRVDKFLRSTNAALSDDSAVSGNPRIFSSNKEENIDIKVNTHKDTSIACQREMCRLLSDYLLSILGM